MQDFITALRFLTAIPIKTKDRGEPSLAGSLAYYPLVGLIIGLIISGIYIASGILIGHLAASAIAVVALVAMTGGIHLDGLSDTADAFFSGRDKASMLDIMRDPRTGAMGVMAIVSAILLQFVAIYSIRAGLEMTALVMMCTLSRWGMVLSVYLFPYARKEGKARLIKDGMTTHIFILSSVIAAVISAAAWGIYGILLMCIAGGISYLIGKKSERLIGGVTGDVLGATNEIIAIAILFIFSIHR